MASSPKPVSIDEYIAGFPPETRKALEEMRAIIKSVAPGKGALSLAIQIRGA
jgi:uncharacterized protein YdhG (YjbR/CyaY superfamily)